MRNKTALSVTLILTAATGWGLIGLFSRPLSGMGLSAIQITFVRSLVIAVGMGIFLFLKNRNLFRIKWKDLWIFLGSGLISIVFFNVCYFLTIQRTTLATASVLLYTAPCFVMLMSAGLFGERVTAQKLTALVLAFLGCMLASGFAGGDIGVFVLLTGIGSGLGYASYSIFGKIALEKYETFTVVFYTFLVAFVGLFPFSRVTDAAAVFAGNSKGILIGLGLGIVSTFIPYITYTSGLQYMEAGKASVLAFAEPMVATIAGIVIFHEKLYLKNALGILLIFCAIILLNIPLEHIFRKK